MADSSTGAGGLPVLAAAGQNGVGGIATERDIMIRARFGPQTRLGVA